MNLSMSKTSMMQKLTVCLCKNSPLEQMEFTYDFLIECYGLDDEIISKLPVVKSSDYDFGEYDSIIKDYVFYLVKNQQDGKKQTLEDMKLSVDKFLGQRKQKKTKAKVKE